MTTSDSSIPVSSITIIVSRSSSLSLTLQSFLYSSRFSTTQTFASVFFRIYSISYSMASLPLGTSIAPRESMERSIASHSGRLSDKRPTLSPLFTPNSIKAEARAFVFSISWIYVVETKTPFSFFPLWHVRSGSALAFS